MIPAKQPSESTLTGKVIAICRSGFTTKSNLVITPASGWLEPLVRLHTLPVLNAYSIHFFIFVSDLRVRETASLGCLRGM